MAYPIRFDKQTAERWLKALKTGQPIEPPGGRWTINDMLALAGGCRFAVMSHGPLSLKDRPGAWEKLPAEHREAREETLELDLRLAIEFHSRLAMLVKDGQFDELFEPHVEAVVYEHDGRRCVRPHQGFRRT